MCVVIIVGNMYMLVVLQVFFKIKHLNDGGAS